MFRMSKGQIVGNASGMREHVAFVERVKGVQAGYPIRHVQEKNILFLVLFYANLGKKEVVQRRVD